MAPLDLREVNYLQTLIGDYHVDTEIEMNAVVDMINQAVEFFRSCAGLFGKHSRHRLKMLFEGGLARVAHFEWQVT